MTTPTPPPDTGTDGGITGAIGSAVGGLVSGSLDGLINGIQTWVNSIESGFAHFVDVILNNIWYGAIVFTGVTMMFVGFYMLAKASPLGGAIDQAQTAASGAMMAALI